MSETRDDEQRAAEALARALEAATPGSEADAEPGLTDLVQTAERVRASAGFAAPLDSGLRDSIISGALDRAAPRQRRPRVVRLLVGAVAAAAAILVLGIAYLLVPQAASTAPEQVAGVGSEAEREAFTAPTDALFDGPFPEEQSPAARVDRILQARTRGYFAALMLKRSSSPVRTAAMLGSSQ